MSIIKKTPLMIVMCAIPKEETFTISQLSF